MDRKDLEVGTLVKWRRIQGRNKGAEIKGFVERFPTGTREQWLADPGGRVLVRSRQGTHSVVEWKHPDQLEQGEVDLFSTMIRGRAPQVGVGDDADRLLALAHWALKEDKPRPAPYYGG